MSEKPFEPMLAADMKTKKGESIHMLNFPVLATPKIDGIRCCIRGGKALSRTLKPIPNHFVRSQLEKFEYNGFDGELVVGETFSNVTSGIMSHEGEPDFTYYVFDRTDIGAKIGYLARLDRLPIRNRKYSREHPRIRILRPTLIWTVEELENYMEQSLLDGHEGVMVRSVNSPYKHGRSTFKEGWLIKIKPFASAEGRIVGYEEQETNTNEASKDERGYTKRSSAQAGKVKNGTLGKIILETEEWGEVKIGTGFTQKERDEIWNNRPSYLGQIGSFRYQAIGMKDKPRIPSWRGIRHPDDM